MSQRRRLTVLIMKAVYPPKTLRRPPARKAAITPRRTPSPPHMPACTLLTCQACWCSSPGRGVLGSTFSWRCTMAMSSKMTSCSYLADCSKMTGQVVHLRSVLKYFQGSLEEGCAQR